MQWIVPEKKLHKFLTDTQTEGRTHKQTHTKVKQGKKSSPDRAYRCIKSKAHNILRITKLNSQFYKKFHCIAGCIPPLLFYMAVLNRFFFITLIKNMPIIISIQKSFV